MSQNRRRIEPWRDLRLGRKTGVRGKPKKRILIVCEGEKTEPNYFMSFRVTTAKIIGLGKWRNTKYIVEEAIQLRDKAQKKQNPYDLVWVVFDRDSFPKNDFENAFSLAKKNGIKIAYSNESFELWYLLHFCYFNTGVSRDDYGKKLSKLLGKEYKKNSKTMYDDLLRRQGNAIKYAKKLVKSYKNHNPEKDNPSTSVFELVEELNKNI